MSVQENSISEQSAENKRKRPYALCLLAFVGIVLIGICHYLWKQPLSWLIQFFGHTSLMIVVVLLVVCIGGWMCLHSLSGIKSEIRRLKEATVTSLYKECAFSGDESKRAEELEYAKGRLKHCKEQLTPDNCDKSGRYFSLVGQRLDIIFKSLEESSDGDKRHPVLPKLNALHDISVHTELSRWYSAGVSTILSFLLVLGIFGTLTGVHEFLGYGSSISEHLPSLAKALLPSAFAVSGTVLLMILRAVYMRWVQYCIALLDELTISVILPALFVGRESVGNRESLAKAIKQLPELSEKNAAGKAPVHLFIAPEEWDKLKDKLKAVRDDVSQRKNESEVVLYEVTEETDVNLLRWPERN